MDFTAAYLEIEATYLVPGGAPLRTMTDVDRTGIRIAAPARANYELYLGSVVEESKATGLVARAVERTGARGVSVAPAAGR